MVSKLKLAETNYFLELLSLEKEPEPFLFKLSAYQNACYSAMQYLLYDMAEKLGLGVTRAEFLDIDKFESTAISSQNQKAQNFADWWWRKNEELFSNTVWRSRGFMAHRGYPDLQQEVTSVYVSGYSSREAIDPRFTATLARSGVFAVWGTPAAPARSEIQQRSIIEEEASKRFVQDCRELCELLGAVLAEAEMSSWD